MSKTADGAELRARVTEETYSSDGRRCCESCTFGQWDEGIFLYCDLRRRAGRELTNSMVDVNGLCHEYRRHDEDQPWA